MTLVAPLMMRLTAKLKLVVNLLLHALKKFVTITVIVKLIAKNKMNVDITQLLKNVRK